MEPIEDAQTTVTVAEDTIKAVAEVDTNVVVDVVAAACVDPVTTTTGQQHPRRRPSSINGGVSSTANSGAGGKRLSTRSTTASVASAGSVMRRSSSSSQQKPNRKKNAASNSGSTADIGDISARVQLRNKLLEQEGRRSSGRRSQLEINEQRQKKKTATPLATAVPLSKHYEEEGGAESDEDDERKRRLTFIFGIVGATLFVLAVLMVGIGLKMSSNAGHSKYDTQKHDLATTHPHLNTSTRKQASSCSWRE
ncbi:hypothetical protein GHT06_007692 [Daphnia sinensis]|uniref:Uncharacterized protein n=1 Tax=Daphnia sinensis TaxID=1820382 RepID=A0AAD5Q1C4_9CRUS|nr:hypothetical protein GHT06_007692 [Daphnia sinensis]